MSKASGVHLGTLTLLHGGFGPFMMVLASIDASGGLFGPSGIHKTGLGCLGAALRP